MMTLEQKLKYLENKNKKWEKIAKELNEDFIPSTLEDVCWELVEERMNNPDEKVEEVEYDEEVEEVEYDEEELFKQLDEDLAEMERQGLLKRTRRS